MDNSQWLSVKDIVSKYKKFNVPSLQRTYRWGEKEITLLLNDKLYKIGDLRVEYSGARLYKVGGARIEYSGNKLYRINGERVEWSGDKVYRVGNRRL